MRNGRAILGLIGWVSLVGEGCGGGEFSSQAGVGGTFADGGASGETSVGGTGTAGSPAASGGAETGGVEQPGGGYPAGGALEGGAPAASGGTETGGVEQPSGGYPSGGALVGGMPAASGGTETGGVEGETGGHPSGGSPSGGVAEVTGGTATGGALPGSGGLASGGAPSGGASSGGASEVVGGSSSGGVATGGAATGGASEVVGGSSSGGVATGGTLFHAGGSPGVAGSVGTGGSGNVCTCIVGLSCCNGTCVNLNNDINNCGECAKVCPGANPFCDNGTCGKPPCSGSACSSAQTCCGSACCADTELCCVVPRAVAGAPECVVPVNGTCPPGNPGAVCASPDTPIATPDGLRAISSLRVGELVYSVDRGRVVAVPVLRARRMAVTSGHTVVRVTLANGSVLEISAPHPTADGRRFGELRAGDQVGALRVVTLETVPYGHAFTYDILPASDSGTYFAGGALIGSTLAGAAKLAISVAAP
jgi:hypothetical protein